MPQKPIKTFIIEEHHEAFIVWNYAIQQGLIPPTGNTLFHVDEHSDMGTPRFNRSIHELNGNLQQVINFTYNELNIANFIIPGVYKGVFSDVFWIKQKHTHEQDKEIPMYVRSFNQEGEKIISSKIKNLGNQEDKDLKLFTYHRCTLEQIPNGIEVMLDIDLDFFSCSGNPNENKEIFIEISRDEYNSFLTNKYHRIHFLNIGKVEVQKIEKKYYYVLNNYKKLYPCSLKVNEDEIKKRIKIFLEILVNNNINIKLISICRSRHSQYTPEDQWKYIEDVLFENLNLKFEIDFKNIF